MIYSFLARLILRSCLFSIFDMKNTTPNHRDMFRDIQFLSISINYTQNYSKLMKNLIVRYLPYLKIKHFFTSITVSCPLKTYMSRMSNDLLKDSNNMICGNNDDSCIIYTSNQHYLIMFSLRIYELLSLIFKQAVLQ